MTLLLAERLSMRARLEDARTDLEGLRDDATPETELWHLLDKMIADCNAAIARTGA